MKGGFSSHWRQRGRTMQQFGQFVRNAFLKQVWCKCKTTHTTTNCTQKMCRYLSFYIVTQSNNAGQRRRRTKEKKAVQEKATRIILEYSTELASVTPEITTSYAAWKRLNLRGDHLHNTIRSRRTGNTVTRVFSLPRWSREGREKNQIFGKVSLGLRHREGKEGCSRG